MLYGKSHRDPVNFVKRVLLELSLKILVSVQNTGQRDFGGFAKVYGRLLKLEQVKHQIYTNTTPQNEYKDIPNTLPRMKKVKQFFIRTCAKTGW